MNILAVVLEPCLRLIAVGADLLADPMAAVALDTFGTAEPDELIGVVSELLAVVLASAAFDY